MIRNADLLLRRIRDVHEAIRAEVTAACEQQSYAALSEVVADDVGDLVFAIDRVSEDVLLKHFEQLSREWSCVLIAEGINADGMITLPESVGLDDAELRVIVDPIDGTRCIMYQKRPAWVLTGVASNRGAATSLADIELAVQTELPLVKQHLSDMFWATPTVLDGERCNRITGERTPLAPQPSRADSVLLGYGSFTRPFPGGRGLTAEIDDLLIERILGFQKPGDTLTFEDQYPSTGGQLYELLMGRDRWLADVRPLLAPILKRQGRAIGHCCHPYDACTEYIARRAGVVIVSPQGAPLAAPLDIHTEVGWVGYANEAIRRQVEPVLHELLREKGLL